MYTLNKDLSIDNNCITFFMQREHLIISMKFKFRGPHLPKLPSPFCIANDWLQSLQSKSVHRSEVFWMRCLVFWPSKHIHWWLTWWPAPWLRRLTSTVLDFTAHCTAAVNPLEPALYGESLHLPPPWCWNFSWLAQGGQGHHLQAGEAADQELGESGPGSSSSGNGDENYLTLYAPRNWWLTLYSIWRQSKGF